MIMKKLATVLLSFLFIASFAKAQKDNSKEDEKIYNKLANMYTMDKFAACIKACDDYIKNDNTARSPYPYLYMSMCYYSIFQDQESFDMKLYKDPLRKAVNFMGRFKKKDKGGELQQENEDYLRDLKKGVLLELANLNDKKDIKMLQSLSRDVAKNYDKDEGMLIISGVYLLRADVKLEGERNIETGMNYLKKKKSEDNLKFSFDDADVLSQAFIQYAEYLNDTKNEASAKTTIAFAKEVLPNSEKLAKYADNMK